MSSWGKKTDHDPKDPTAKEDPRDAPPPDVPAKQAPMRLNKETADPQAEINPHNEALAQHPVENAEQKLNEAEEYLKDTHLGRLQAWKQRVFLGGPRSGDWDEFDQLINEGKETVAPKRGVSGTKAKADK